MRIMTKRPGLLRRLRAAFSGDTPPMPIDRVIAAMKGVSDAPMASRVDALSISAVLRGRNLLAGLATLPLQQFDSTNRPAPSPLLQQIDPDVANVVTVAQTLEDLLFEGISWWRVTERDRAGYPTAARHLDFTAVSINPPTRSGTPAPLPSGWDPRGGTVWIDGHPVDGADVIRFDSPNPGLLHVAGRPLRRALLLDRAAAMYANDPQPRAFFTPDDNEVDPVDDDEVRGILNDWESARKERTTAYVPAALKYNTVDTPSPADLQLVELQRQVTLELANSIGLDPEDVGVSTTSRTYQNATDRRQDRINDMFAPYMSAMTDRLGMRDVSRRGRYVAFNLDRYLRADPKTRWETYEIARRIGGLSHEEMRLEEGRPAEHVEPLAAPRPAGPAPASPTSGRMAARSVAHAFAGETAGFTAGPIELTPVDGNSYCFEGEPGGGYQFDLAVRNLGVDIEARTITGVAMPAGATATKYGRRWRFAVGALRWLELGRVKMLRDHDRSQAIGRAIRMEYTADGSLIVTFKISRGAAGDEALALAEDGVYDGLSVGVNFTEENTRRDPSDPTVTLVDSAEVEEVSLVAMPAFSNARVTTVRATAGEDHPMDPCAECGHVHAVGTPHGTPAITPPPAAPVVPASFNAEQVMAMFAAMTGAAPPPLAPGQPGVPAGDPADDGQRAGVVNPTFSAGTTGTRVSVNEAAPYRFDRNGNLRAGTHEFSTDLINGLKNGDQAAHGRAMGFISAQFDTDRADTAGLNPNVQRPDMFVDQLDYTTPLWDMVNRGTLANITPFTLPKFDSATGLVGPHTEGVEPTAGTYVVTTQTITPTAISGKAEITREAWDQGGNPQISTLIWNQMRREWFEDLEAATGTFLNTLTAATDIALTTAAADEALAAEWEAALASLQFIRGGNRLRSFAVHIDLYKRFAAARDDVGRPLYPIIGPSNANGTSAPRFRTLDLAGVTGVPSWALGASGAVSANSWLFSPEDVHGWASAPQRLEFQYQVKSVELAIWGYSAFANTRIDGVRQVTYDPTA